MKKKSIARTLLVKFYPIIRIVFTLLLLFFLLNLSLKSAAYFSNSPATTLARQNTFSPCERPGWFPESFGLKDHTIFWYDGLYYLAAIYIDPKGDTMGGEWFAYASTPDLCNWNDLGGILKNRPPGSWDEARVWAPYVYEENNVYYMFYTGVTNAFAQSIMLATSTDPANPNSWVRQGVVFQPYHDGSIWRGGDLWSDCRDPTVIKSGDRYFLYYTGLDTDGGIIGLATASSLWGPWTDWGAIVTKHGVMLESPTLATHSGWFYLFYNETSGAGLGEVFRNKPFPPPGWNNIYRNRQISTTARGEVFHYGPTLVGPWSEIYLFRPGWGHEISLNKDRILYTSFLTDYTVTIQPVIWNTLYSPPHPSIGEKIYYSFLPLIQL